MESTIISLTEQNVVNYAELDANYFANTKRTLNQAYKKHLAKLDGLQKQYQEKDKLNIFQQIKQAFIVEIKCIEEEHFEKVKVEAKQNNGGIQTDDCYKLVGDTDYEQIFDKLNINIIHNRHIFALLYLLGEKKLESDKSKEMLKDLENAITKSNADMNEKEVKELMDQITTKLTELFYHLNCVLDLKLKKTIKEEEEKRKKEEEDAKKNEEAAKQSVEELLAEYQTTKNNNKSNKVSKTDKKKKQLDKKKAYEEKKKKEEEERKRKEEKEKRQKKAEKYKEFARNVYNVLDKRQNKKEISLDKNGKEASLKKIKALYTWKNNTEKLKLRENNAIKTLVKLKRNQERQQKNKEQQQMIKSFYRWKNKTEKLKLNDVKTELDNLREKNTKVTEKLKKNTKEYNEWKKESNNFNKMLNAKTKELKEIQNKFDKLNVDYSRISTENGEKDKTIIKQHQIISDLRKQDMDNRTEKSTLQKELQDTNIKLNNTAEYTNWLYQDRERVQNENNQLRRIINNYQRYRINPAMQFITNGH